LGKKGGKKHVKRLAAPRLWPIHKKEARWTVRARPGPHPKDECLPAVLVLRDILGVARTREEAELILSEGQFRVDGKVRRDASFPVGLMDVVELPLMKKVYRVLPFPDKGLGLHSIGDAEKGFKLCRIVNKVTVEGGNVQINLHDGRNILVRPGVSKAGAESVYATSDVLKISIPDSKILDSVKLEDGAVTMVVHGRNAGRYGRIVSIGREAGPIREMVTIEEEGGSRIQTSIDSVFVLGKEESLVSLSGVRGGG